MTSGAGSTDHHYHRLLDKLKNRSNRIFVKAQMKNRAQEQRLKGVVSILEKDRDLCIRKSHEGIWRVPCKECPVRRLDRPEGLPAYLARPRATTLPTPAELATLLPKNRVGRQQPHVFHPQPIATVKPREYTKISKRNLSTMTSDQIQIYHYRKVLEDIEEAAQSEDFQEGDGKKGPAIAADGGTEKKMDTSTAKGGDTSDGKLATPVTRTKSVTREASIALADDENTRAAEESVRMIMKKLGMRPQSSPMSHSRKPRPKQKRPNTSTGSFTTITGQQLDSPSKVLQNNFLDMYKTQLQCHVDRVTKTGEIPAQSVRIDDMVPHSGHREERPKSGFERSALPRSSTPRKAASLARSKASSTFSPGSRGIKKPGPKERASTLMQQTASSTLRSTPSRQLRRVSAPEDEVLNTKSSCNLRQMDDIAQAQDLEDDELFEEIKHCRYIRWAKADEAFTEETGENEPLQNQLARLTLKYASREVKPKKNGGENT